MKNIESNLCTPVYEKKLDKICRLIYTIRRIGKTMERHGSRIKHKSNLGNIKTAYPYVGRGRDPRFILPSVCLGEL